MLEGGTPLNSAISLKDSAKQLGSLVQLICQNRLVIRSKRMIRKDHKPIKIQQTSIISKTIRYF